MKLSDIATLIVQRVQSITAKDINVAAQKYLNNNMFHKVYVG